MVFGRKDNMKRKAIGIVSAVIAALVMLWLLAFLILYTGVPLHRDFAFSVIKAGEENSSGTVLVQADGTLKYNLFTFSPIEFQGRVIAYGDAKGRYLPEEPPYCSAFFQRGGILVLMEDDSAWPYDAAARWALHGKRILLVEKGGDFLNSTIFVNDERLSRSGLSSVFHP